MSPWADAETVAFWGWLAGGAVSRAAAETDAFRLPYALEFGTSPIQM